MEDLKSILYTLAAAACGAYVSSVINPKPLTLTRRVLGGTCGIMIAYWCAAPLADYFGISEQRAVSAFTFGVALFWEKVIALFSTFVEEFGKRVLNRAEGNKE